MNINWRLIKELASKNKPIPELMKELADLSEKLVDWGRERGFEEHDCKSAYLEIFHGKQKYPSMSDLFEAVRQKLTNGKH